jgi:hypothetical protein
MGYTEGETGNYKVRPIGSTSAARSGIHCQRKGTKQRKTARDQERQLVAGAETFGRNELMKWLRDTEVEEHAVAHAN